MFKCFQVMNFMLFMHVYMNVDLVNNSVLYNVVKI